MKNNFLYENIKIYNSISGKKEIFKPKKEKFIGIYVCGPTMYNYIHLGNCRTFISFDLIIRYFKHIGYTVRYIRNITDIGHLENEEIDNKKKIINNNNNDIIEPMEIVQKYINNFHYILYLFNNKEPSIEPYATGHILDQIKIIKNLINNNLAYHINGSVYFDLKNYIDFIYNKKEYKSYGILSKNKINEFIIKNKNLKWKKEKKSFQDFALWKKASKKHIMKWDSPWGEGFPGWHIECTSMSSKYLGDNFDIHGGGIDLKFPHHECEIAQFQGNYKKNPVNYWMHTNLLTFNKKKMSKSIGNTILPLEIFSGNNKFLDKSFSPEVVRFFILKNHYRSVLDFSNKSLIYAEKEYYRIANSFIDLEKLLLLNKSTKTSTFNIKLWIRNCYESMNDDFNSPKLISYLFEICSLIKKIFEKKEYLIFSDLILLKKNMLIFFSEILGLKNIFISDKEILEKKLYNNKFLNIYYKLKILDNKKLNNNIFNQKNSENLLKIIIKIREIIKKNKNWVLSDKIRNDLLKIGYIISDNKDGTTSIKNLF